MSKHGSHSAQPILLRPEGPAGTLRSGEVIAERYAVERLLGRGGMGDVYLASRNDGGPDVAVKILSDRWLDQPDAVARFDREATRLRSVEHPNVVALYDSGVDRGRPYLVMEYIDGEPLNEFLERRGALTLRDFVPIAAQLLKGMGHAHLREMMIRDVKPSNIMLCARKGRANFVKLLDFGLAKFTSKEPPLTEGQVLGTAGYLAPEAIRGEELDLRVDVYAIGVVFYQMLSGKLPFEDCESTTLLYKTLDAVPTALAEIVPEGHEIPEALLTLVSDCLEKDRELRPSDANIIVERLIDAVPASLFRLPTTEQSSRSPGYGNSGLMELVRVNPSARFPSVPRAEVVEAEASPPQPRATRWLAIIGVTVLVSLATAYSVVSTAGDSAVPESPASGVSSASVLPLPGEHQSIDATPDIDASRPMGPPTPEAGTPTQTPPSREAVANAGNTMSPGAGDTTSAGQPKTKPTSRRRRRRQGSAPAPASSNPQTGPFPPEASEAETPKPRPPSPVADPPKDPSTQKPRSPVFLSADRDESPKTRMGADARPSLLPAR